MNRFCKRAAILISAAVVLGLQIAAGQNATGSTSKQVPMEVPRRVRNIAREITVQIITTDISDEGENVGTCSGVIIGRSDKNYYVLTAKNVVSNPRMTGYFVVTHGRAFEADYVGESPLGELVLLKFTSDRNYTPTCIDKNVDPGTPVYLSGLVRSEKEPRRLLTSGQIIEFQDVPETQAGHDPLFYSNKTEQGMSGGPLLNENGCVVGIHKGRMYKSGFGSGIGINQAIEMLAIALDRSVQKVERTTEARVRNIAREITVVITRPNNLNPKNRSFAGSGVIIARSDTTYYVLTTRHAVRREEQEYEVETSDGQAHKVERSNGDLLSQNLDLVLFKFTSDRNYNQTCIGDSERLYPGTPVYLSGWVKSDWIKKEGKPRFIDGQIIQRRERTDNQEGYNLIYSNEADNGMSGGPLLSADGCVVGIHGRSQAIQEWGNGKKYLGIGIEKAKRALIIATREVEVENKPDSSSNTSTASRRGQAEFFCGRNNGVPATIASHPSRGNVVLIRWVSDYYTASGLTPQRMCEMVSERFQRVHLTFAQGAIILANCGLANCGLANCSLAFSKLESPAQS